MAESEGVLARIQETPIKMGCFPSSLPGFFLESEPLLDELQVLRSLISRALLHSTAERR